MAVTIPTVPPMNFVLEQDLAHSERHTIQYNAYENEPNKDSNFSADTDSNRTNFPHQNVYNYAFRVYYADSPEYMVQEILFKYFSPLLVLFGTVGNILAFYVLRRRLTTKNSIYFYLTGYAVVCTLTLCLSWGLDWIAIMTDTRHIYNQADWLCRLWKFAFSVVQYSGSWLVTLMVFDRFIYVCLPSRAHSICSVFSAHVFTCLVAVLLVAVGIHAMWTYELHPEGVCTIPSYTRSDFQTDVWPLIAATIHSYIPMLIVIIFDILIVLNLAVQIARQYESRNFSAVQQQLIWGVLVVSLTYIILTLPQLIINAIMYVDPQASYFKSFQAQTSLAFGVFVCTLLSSVLLAINLPLYLLALPAFRNELLLCAQRRPVSQTTEASNIELRTNGIHIQPLLKIDNDDEQKRHSKNCDQITKL